MNARELMRLHVRALFTLDDDERLVAVNEPGGGPAPRFFLGRTARGALWWVRGDVRPDIADELGSLCRALPAGGPLDTDGVSSASFVECLSRQAPVERVWSGPAYECPPDLPVDEATVRIIRANVELLSPHLEEWREDVEADVPMAASLHEGVAASVCCSARASEAAHEAGVETHPELRGRGHGRRAVSAWAGLVRAMGCVPLYSTSWENAPSRALAAGLGLRLFGSDLHLT